MAKHYAKLWSGNFYTEVTRDYKSTKRKKSTRIRQKNNQRRSRALIFDSARVKLIKRAPKPDTPRSIDVKKQGERNCLSNQSVILVRTLTMKINYAT